MANCIKLYLHCIKSNQISKKNGGWHLNFKPDERKIDMDKNIL